MVTSLLTRLAQSKLRLVQELAARLLSSSPRRSPSADALITSSSGVRLHGMDLSPPRQWVSLKPPPHEPVLKNERSPMSDSNNEVVGVLLSEEELQALLEQSTGPRVTLEAIKDKIVEVTFYRHKHQTLCVVELFNGFFVNGEAAPADPQNFKEEIGKHYAFEQALRKIWPLEGYRLRHQLYLEETGTGAGK